MNATFVELPPFQRLRDTYFTDDSFKEFQLELMRAPEAGDVIRDTGGLRKVRFADERRNKGKRSGLRVIYYWRAIAHEFWLFTVYDKDQADDLTSDQRKLMKRRLESEIEARSGKA